MRVGAFKSCQDWNSLLKACCQSSAAVGANGPAGTHPAGTHQTRAFRRAASTTQERLSHQIATMAAFGADDALGAMMAATLPRSTMSKDQMQSIANGARPKTARPKTARPKKETTPWTKEDVTKLKKACKDVPSTVEKQQRWRQISGIVGRGKRECYDKYKELKEAQKTKNELKKTMTRAKEGSTFEERLAALGLKEPAADAEPASAPAPAPAAPAPAASPSSAWGGGADAPAPTQTRMRRTFFGAEDLVIDDGAEAEPEAPPPPADEPPPQSGRTRCVAANDLVLDECGDEL